MIIIV